MTDEPIETCNICNHSENLHETKYGCKHVDDQGLCMCGKEPYDFAVERSSGAAELRHQISALTLTVGERDAKIEKLREAMRHYATYGDAHSLQAALSLLAETAPATEAGK